MRTRIVGSTPYPESKSTPSRGLRPQHTCSSTSHVFRTVHGVTRTEGGKLQQLVKCPCGAAEWIEIQPWNLSSRR
jgi:hypothetical protein